MPVYEYLCNDCGPFKDMRPMSECDLPQDCPHCESEAPRVIMTAPNFFCMPSDKKKAHATNERSANAPKTVAEYKASHGPGCGCCSSEAGAAGNKDEGRRQGVSDRAPLDDQPLMPHDV
jgi:putative FmdB family regulatory protein